MLAFIDAHRDAYGVESICEQLPIAPSTYYESKARQSDPNRVPERARRDAKLKTEIQRVHEAHFGVYGAQGVAPAQARGCRRRALYRRAADALARLAGRGAWQALPHNDC